MRRAHRRAVLAMVLGMVMVPWPAHATSLNVAPTRIELGPSSRTGSVTLSNTGETATTVQVETFAWRQGNSVAELEPTRGLLAVPAVFNLDEGGRQVIRVATREPAPAAVETAYRLVISEVPVAGDSASAGVRFALRLSLPVFITPEGAAPVPDWRLVRDGAGPALELRNAGTAHLHVSRLDLSAGADRRRIALIETPSYVLAGNTQRWPLPGLRRGERVRLEAATSLGDLVVELAD